MDTRNGRAPFVPKLKVKRNTNYAIVLRPDGSEFGRVVKPRTLAPVIALMQRAVTPDAK